VPWTAFSHWVLACQSVLGWCAGLAHEDVLMEMRDTRADDRGEHEVRVQAGPQA
jgi:hypothetical protein